MPQKINCVQAYKIMYHFMDMLYFETYDNDLGAFLGSAVLYFDVSDNSPKTMDLAIWYDWMNAIKGVIEDNSINYTFQLSIEQAYISMHEYFATHCNIDSNSSFQVLRNLKNKNALDHALQKWLLEKWNTSINFVLQQGVEEKNGNFFTADTELNERESFRIMQGFLDALCQKNHDPEVIKLVQNSRLKNRSDYLALVPNIIDPNIWHIWQQSIRTVLLEVPHRKLNALVAYKSMPLFLLSYFNNDSSAFINAMISKFQVPDDTKPQTSFYWRNWLTILVKINARQIEVANNLVSINTLISYDLAFKIVKAWFVKYELLVGLDIIQHFLHDKTLWEQAVVQVKKQRVSYILQDDEATVLEVYHMMLHVLELVGKNIDQFAIDVIKPHKPKNFTILLEWIRSSSLVIKNI